MSETYYGSEATTGPVYGDDDLLNGYTTFEDSGAVTRDDGGGDAPSDGGEGGGGEGGGGSDGGEGPPRPPDDDDDDHTDAPRDPKKPLTGRELSERFLPGNAFSTEEIFGLFGALAESSLPQRQGFLDAALAHRRAMEQGSPAAILDEIRPRVGQIRGELQNAFTAISRRLGPQGGGQLDRENALALNQFSQALAGEFAGAQFKGVRDLNETLSGFRPTLAAQLPQPTEEKTPFNPIPLAQSFAGALGAGVRAWNTPGAAQPTTTQATTMQPTAGNPYPYAAAPYGGERNF